MHVMRHFDHRNRIASAVSAGDLRDAPFPDGATEFVDFDRDVAMAQGGMRSWS